MNNRDFKIYWGIRKLKSATNAGDSLSYFLQGCLDSGITQQRLDRLIDKVNKDIKEKYIPM